MKESRRATRTTANCVNISVRILPYIIYPALTALLPSDSMNITNAVCDVPPRSRQATQIGVGSSFIALTTIIMGLRMAGRPPFSAAFGIDDVVGFVTFVRALLWVWNIPN